VCGFVFAGKLIASTVTKLLHLRGVNWSVYVCEKFGVLIVSSVKRRSLMCAPTTGQNFESVATEKGKSCMVLQQ